ncbi:hypothetical protein CPB84DRAFT_1759692 [Gymnopilus junonius]|uniref:MIT domain-containing protein n=1 Tax=Gymnopilus junonius TaxID=109634 RepID=A0A9P5P386_GYMJU|nr:hypothetical protein CPB84DRAFT_1759692 [Gymnopilus junonius]
MEIEWETSPAPHRTDGRHWHEHSPPPVSFPSPSSLISQRRRSSAANTRPAGPPPNLPIPSVPGSSSAAQQPLPDFSDSPSYSSLSRGSRSSSFARPSASPNLSAVAAFSQARQASSSQSNSSSMTPSIDDLSDPPPQSYLPPSSFRPPDRNHDALTQPDRNLLSPPGDLGHRSEHRPSSRRALTRALELAREAVQLDSTNDNPEAAVNAYAQSVALLSEVMERVRNGEDSTSDGPRRRRRRSVAAQEEEVRRLQNIHDTYADRMNILSIIYSIPPVPYQSTSAYSNPAVSGGESTTSTSPTTSVSPSSDNSPQIPQQVYTPYIPDEYPNPNSNPSAQYADQRDSVYRLDESVLTGSAISGLPSTTHPYAVQYDMSPQMQPAPSPPRNSVVARRKRASSNLPPKPPPPNSSLPLAPMLHSDETFSELTSQIPKRSENQLRAAGDAPGHRRTPSGLQALEEETEESGRQNNGPRENIVDNERSVPDVPTPRTTKPDSPPLPPLPSPTSPDAFGTPRNGLAKPPSSPGLPNSAQARPRALSQVPVRSGEVPNINATNQGTIYQRRKTSAPPSTRSASPAESVTSAGSAPQTIPPLPTNVHGSVRSRSSSQPGRRPSIIGGRVSPDQPPPLPGTASNGVSRKTSAASKLTPSLSNLHLDSLPPPTLQSTVGLYPGYPPNLPTTPTSPLPPAPPSDPLLKPYHMMKLLRNTMMVQTGGYVTRRLHVPCEVWSQGGAKLTSLDEKIRVVTILCSALDDLELSSSDHFGAGNVSSGLALGIGSIGRKEAEGWLSKLDEFSNVCDHIVANFGKKLGVGEGFVSRKPTWGGKLFSRFDKFTNNGKNLDSPAAYVQGLRKLFQQTLLLDEHTRAILSQPIAPAYGAFPPDLRGSAEQKLKRFSEFFASVVLTFVIRDLSQLLDKYVKKCEKWLAE